MNKIIKYGIIFGLLVTCTIIGVIVFRRSSIQHFSVHVVGYQPVNKDINGNNSEVLLNIDLSESKMLSEMEVLNLPRDDPRKENLLIRQLAEKLPEEIRKEYASLLNKLSVDEEKKEEVVNALVAHELMSREVFAYLRPTEVMVEVYVPVSLVRPVAGNVSILANTGDTSGMNTKIAALNSTIAASLSGILNESDITLFEHALNSEYISSQVSDINDLMSRYAKQGLNDEQTNLLTNTLITENPTQSIGKLNVITDQTIQVAATFLTTEQLAVLKDVYQMKANVDLAVAEALKKLAK